MEAGGDKGLRRHVGGVAFQGVLVYLGERSSILHEKPLNI